ncbi:mCG1037590, isoform CRA_b, partial [Mus musculus]
TTPLPFYLLESLSQRTVFVVGEPQISTGARLYRKLQASSQWRLTTTCEFILPHQFRSQFTVAPWCPQSGSKERWMLVLNPTSPFYPALDHSPLHDGATLGHHPSARHMQPPSFGLSASRTVSHVSLFINYPASSALL